MAGPFPWVLDPSTCLRPFTLADAPVLRAVIAENQAHLDHWLRWSSTISSVEEAERFLTQFDTNRGLYLGIWCDGVLAGGVVCWGIHPQHRSAEVGYWLAERFVGRGLITRGVERMLAHLFEDHRLHRVEMQCAVGNTRSRAIPERFGFTMEGVRRDSHWITTRFLDHCVYGMLEEEWRNRETRDGSR